MERKDNAMKYRYIPTILLSAALLTACGSSGVKPVNGLAEATTTPAAAGTEAGSAAGGTVTIDLGNAAEGEAAAINEPEDLGFLAEFPYDTGSKKEYTVTETITTKASSFDQMEEYDDAHAIVLNLNGNGLEITTGAAASNEAKENYIAEAIVMDGNKICIYRPDDEEPAFTLDLDYAHNVVWDKERQLLWSASMGMVYSFKYLVGEDGPRLELDSMTPCPASVTEAHELSPVYGKPALYVSFAKGVFSFDCVTKTFTEEKVPNDTGVKSLTEGPSGYPLTVLRATSSWWSPELHTVDGGLLLYESSFHLYKARWFVDNPFSYKYE